MYSSNLRYRALVRVVRVLVTAALLAAVGSAARRAQACTPGPNEIAIFEHSNFGAPCAIRGIGTFDTAQLGLPNDKISSLKVGSNVRALLFEHSGCTGREANFESGNWAFVGISANDKTSSLRVEAGHLPTVYTGDFPAIGERP